MYKNQILICIIVLTLIQCTSSGSFMKKGDLPVGVKFYPENKWQSYEMPSGFASLRYKQLFDAHWKLKPYGYPLNFNPFIEILRKDTKGKFKEVIIVGEVEVNAVDVKSQYLNEADEFFKKGKMAYYVGEVKNVGYLFYEKRIWDSVVSTVKAEK